MSDNADNHLYPSLRSLGRLVPVDVFKSIFQVQEDTNKTNTNSTIDSKNDKINPKPPLHVGVK